MPSTRDFPALFLSASRGFITATTILSNTSNTGLALDPGNAIGLVNTTLHLRDSVIAGHASAHGAISSYNSTLWLDHVTMRQNQGRSAAAGMFLDATTAHISASVFDHNTGKEVGAIAAFVKPPHVMLITDTLFLGNQALGSHGTGGGIAAAGLVTVTNSIFSGNRAAQDGGAVSINYAVVNSVSIPSRIALINTTLVSNTAPLGSAVAAFTAMAELHNAIVWSNGAGPLFATPSGTLNVSDSLVAGGYVSGTNILDADPQFVDAAGADAISGTLDDNLQLRLSSPAINRGANQWLQGVATDLAGQPRVVGGVVDLRRV